MTDTRPAFDVNDLKNLGMNDEPHVDIDGVRYVLSFHYDEDGTPPWENEDGHGPIRRERYDYRKRPGERILHKGERSSDDVFVYDWQEALVIAKRDGWGFPPGKIVTAYLSDTGQWSATADGLTGTGVDGNEAIKNLYALHRSTMTTKQYAACAVQNDFDYLRKWCKNDWWYVGVSVQAFELGEDGEPGEELTDEFGHAVWRVDFGYDNDPSYLKELADDQLYACVKEVAKHKVAA